MNEHENWHLWWKRACMHVWIWTHTYIYAQSGNCQMLENYTTIKTATHLLEVQTCGKLRWCMDKEAFLWNQNIPCVLTNSTVLMHTDSPNHRKGTHSKLCKFHAHGKAQKWGICLFTANCPHAVLTVPFGVWPQQLTHHVDSQPCPSHFLLLASSFFLLTIHKQAKLTPPKCALNTQSILI